MRKKLLQNFHVFPFCAHLPEVKLDFSFHNFLYVLQINNLFSSLQFFFFFLPFYQSFYFFHSFSKFLFFFFLHENFIDFYAFSLSPNFSGWKILLFFIFFLRIKFTFVKKLIAVLIWKFRSSEKYVFFFFIFFSEPVAFACLEVIIKKKKKKMSYTRPFGILEEFISFFAMLFFSELFLAFYSRNLTTALTFF